jgi:hypothetical protein
LKNLIEDDFCDDFEEVEVEKEIEKIQLRSHAEYVLRSIQITRSKHFKKDIKKIAKYYIRKFFKNKNGMQGEKLNISLIYDKSNIEKMINTNILDSTNIIYKTLKDTSYSEKSKTQKDVTKDIILVNEALKKIYKSKIPQQFAGGMLLLYLEFCKGIKFET